MFEDRALDEKVFGLTQNIFFVQFPCDLMADRLSLFFCYQDNPIAV